MRPALLLAALVALAPGALHAKPKPKKPNAHAAAKAPAKPAKRATLVLKAAPAKPREVRFLGLEPHGPLAVVRHGKNGAELGSPKESACRTWGAIGSRWRSLDALGQVVGEVEVTGGERYDVTNCDELALRTRSGKGGVGVYVSKGYAPVALTAWKPAGTARRQLEALIRARDAKLPTVRFQKKADLPLDERMLAWKTPSGDELVAVGGRGLTVFRLESGRWKVLHERKPQKADVGHADMFKPLSALDMDGNGTVELVVHERALDAYWDFTLTPRGRGYEEISAGIHGAFA